MPYPFDSALAVASDVDGALRDTYTGYTHMLVHDLGLDFGDSAWLHWRYVFNANGDAVATNSGGFLSPSLTQDTRDPATVFKRNRHFREVMADYQEGSIDHFHALLPHGPRLAILTKIVSEGGSLSADIPPLDRSCADFHLFGICFVSNGAAAGEIRSVHAECSDGESAGYEPVDHDFPSDGNRYSLFIRNVNPEETEAVPHLRNISRILARTSAAGDSVPTRIILLSTYGPLILDRLEFLRRNYNVEMSLATEHSAFHFRNPRATQFLRASNARQFEAQADTLWAFNGPLDDCDGRLIASLDSDEPHSFARLLPEAVDDAELRFIVPIPASKTKGLLITELLARSPTRSGGGIYWANRVQPNVVDPEPGATFDGRTRHDTFVARVARAVEGAAEEPGGYWPIYTHLGGLARIDGKRIDFPDPYFEPGPLLELQDRVFGITGRVPGGARIWFARANALYDYALLLQELPGQVERSAPNSINVRSWDDAVLGKRLPRSASHLYGQTFYVDDETEAQVALDDVAIDHVTRNPADGSGRPSVTIAECDISLTIFRALDPALAAGCSVQAGGWTWSDGSEPHGRLSATSDAIASVRIPMHETQLPGAQLLSFRLRTDAEAKAGLLLETGSGGRFWFGSAELADELGEITAIYPLDRLMKPGEWRRMVVPFHDLRWAPRAAPGGPLPSHPIEAVSLTCRAGAAEFADVRLLRPRTSTAARHPARGHCVIGVIPGAGQGELVRLCPPGQPDRAQTARTDQLGWFSFTGVAPGLYDVMGSKDGVQHQSARGPTIEIWSDVPRLALSQPVSAPAD